jgi:hypothetical protein
MLKRYGEISNLGIITLSTSIALIGTLILVFEKPLTPNTLVAFEHSLFREQPSNF